MADDADSSWNIGDLELPPRLWARIGWLTLRGLLRHGPTLDQDPAIKYLPAHPARRHIERARSALLAHVIVFRIRHKGQLPDVPDSIANISELPYGVRFQVQAGLLLATLEEGDGAAYNTALRAIRDGTFESVIALEIEIEALEQSKQSDVEMPGDGH